jgi:formate hydrogenlyase subunit 3/multisubunit Na+/H+ antiporter MnhD subunit
VYGALVAMVQPDVKKLIAYSSVSHLGFVVLGIAALNMQGMQGAIYQMLNHGVSTGALFMVAGMLSDRRHTRLISEFGGLKAVMPMLVRVFLISTLASIGLPGLNGFVGEFLILVGAFQWDPRFAAVAALGVILSAVYMLWMFQRVNYGPLTNEKNRGLADLSRRERWMIVPTVVMAIVMGVAPSVFLRPMAPSVEKLLARTGLFDQRFVPCALLSQGCLRRLEFARALACRPKLLILDEVFSALSAADEEELAALLRAANRDEGTAFLLVSHNPPLLKSLCRRILVLEEGRIARERRV